MSSNRLCIAVFHPAIEAASHPTLGAGGQRVAAVDADANANADANVNAGMNAKADAAPPAQRQYLPVEVLMSTPHTLVVRARVAWPAEPDWHDIELVVARRHCRGEQPSVQALMEAVPHGLTRLRSRAATEAVPLTQTKPPSA